MEETDSGDESEEESDDDKPVREQMNETVGGNGRSIDASNPNAVLEGLEGHAVSANASGQRDVKSTNTTKTNTSASTSTSKDTNANKPPRASSSVSSTTQPSTASVPANSTTAHGSEGGNRPNIALDTDDKSVAEHVCDYKPGGLQAGGMVRAGIQDGWWLKKQFTRWNWP